MSIITRERAFTLLTDLIAIPSVNPMGRDLKLTEPVERKAVDYIESLFRPYGVRMTREAVSPIHESLLISISGKTDHPYTGRFFKAGGRYVCVHTTKIGEKVVSEFDLGKAAEQYFKLSEVPPISGYAIAIDTDNAKGAATAKSWVKKIEYLN